MNYLIAITQLRVIIAMLVVILGMTKALLFTMVAARVLQDRKIELL